MGMITTCCTCMFKMFKLITTYCTCMFKKNQLYQIFFCTCSKKIGHGQNNNVHAWHEQHYKNVHAWSAFYTNTVHMCYE
jgi:hypothetical protein